MTKTTIVAERILQTRQALTSLHRKQYRLRRLLAGDVDALKDAGGQSDPANEFRRGDRLSYPDILVTDIEEGRSNKLLQYARTLSLQTQYRFPEIEMEDLEPEEAAVNSGYLQFVLSQPPIGCGATVQMRRALMHFLVDGFGVAWIGSNRGRPLVQNLDPFDFTYDLTAHSFSECRWMSASVTASCSYWRDMFGSEFNGLASKLKADDESMKPVALEFYYSVDDEWMVLPRTGDMDIDTDAVVQGPNPYYFEILDRRVPFLPFEVLASAEIPSTAAPVSLVEQALPAQIAVWRTDDLLRSYTDLPSFYEWEKGTLDAEEEQKFEDGEVGAFIRRNAGTTGIELKSAAPLPQSLMAYRQENDGELVAQFGVNPYASGAPVEGTEYAAEVNAIQSSSDLMASSVSKEMADMWVRVSRKVLAAGKLYDELPVKIEYDGVKHEFGPAFPIAPYLDPFAKIVIREDSTVFTNRQQKTSEALMDIDTALKLAQMFPNAPMEAYENYLRVRGEKNVDKYLSAPEIAPAPLVDVAT